jgi:hypothetical protein
MKPWSLLPHSQELATTCPCPEPKSEAREMVRNMVTFYAEVFVSTSPSPPSSRTTPCRLSETSYSVYSQLSSISSAGWHCWWKHCATSRKVAGSIPSVAIVIVFSLNTCDRTLALVSTQPPTKEQQGYILGRGKDGRCVGPRTLQP